MRSEKHEAGDPGQVETVGLDRWSWKENEMLIRS